MEGSPGIVSSVVLSGSGVVVMSRVPSLVTSPLSLTSGLTTTWSVVLPSGFCSSSSEPTEEEKEEIQGTLSGALESIKNEDGSYRWDELDKVGSFDAAHEAGGEDADLSLTSGLTTTWSVVLPSGFCSSCPPSSSPPGFPLSSPASGWGAGSTSLDAKPGAVVPR